MADTLGHPITQILPGIEETPFVTNLGNVARTGESTAFEQYVEPLSRHLFVSAYRLDETRIATVFTDVTERKRAEETLQESESRLRAITDSAQDAILMMDPEGRISYWNPAAERIFGYTGAEAIGRDLHSFIVPPRYHGAHQSAFPAFRQTGQGAAVGKTLDLEALRKDGSEVSVQLSLSAIEIGGLWHSVGLLRDITIRKRAEAELRETNRHLERATARANDMAAQAEMASVAKSQFLANMSHEIRTPMNGVIGMAGLLLDTDLNEEQRRYAEIVRASGESLLGIINDILDFSKIEAKKLDLETLDFDLANLLDDFGATLAFRAHEKGLELLCAIDPEVPTLLKGDPGRLRQILTNLAGNAIKFTNSGEVSIAVALASEDESEALLRFSVRDTGIGIPEEKIGLLFNKFSQVDASTTREYGGTGLGLAISRQLAELMGGETGVSSEKGKGSEFWFTARLGKRAESAPAKARPPADLSNARALIVDDNAASREILMKRLRAWGMRPSEAQDGAEGLRALHRALEEKRPLPDRGHRHADAGHGRTDTGTNHKVGRETGKPPHGRSDFFGNARRHPRIRGGRLRRLRHQADKPP